MSLKVCEQRLTCVSKRMGVQKYVSKGFFSLVRVKRLELQKALATFSENLSRFNSLLLTVNIVPGASLL